MIWIFLNCIFIFCFQCLHQSNFAGKVLSNYEICSRFFSKIFDIGIFVFYSSWMCEIVWATPKPMKWNRPNSLWKGVRLTRYSKVLGKRQCLLVLKKLSNNNQCVLQGSFSYLYTANQFEVWWKELNNRIAVKKG